MSREEALKQLVEARANEDTESAHRHADSIICDLLIELGYQDIVNAYDKIEKWYD